MIQATVGMSGSEPEREENEMQSAIVRLIAEKKKSEADLSKMKHVAKKLLQQQQKKDTEIQALKQRSLDAKQYADEVQGEHKEMKQRLAAMINEQQKSDSEGTVLKDVSDQYEQRLIEEEECTVDVLKQYNDLKQRFNALQADLKQKILIESNAKLIEEGTNNYSSEFIEELKSENEKLRMQLETIKKDQAAKLESAANEYNQQILRLEKKLEERTKDSVSLQDHNTAITEWQSKYDAVVETQRSEMNELAAKYDQLIQNQAELMLKHSEELRHDAKLKDIATKLRADNEKLVKHIVKMTKEADVAKARAVKLKCIFMGSLIIGTVIYWLNGKRESSKSN